MKLKKELVDELIRISKTYYRTGKTDFLTELNEAEIKLKQKNGWITWDVINLIEDLSKFIQYSGKGTNNDIHKALEVFGVIVE